MVVVQLLYTNVHRLEMEARSKNAHSKNKGAHIYGAKMAQSQQTCRK